jgi:hypothetical protein
MQINNSIPSYTFEYKNINEISKKEISNAPSKSSKESNTLKNMTLDEIKSYLKENNIEDDSNTRADILFEIQKYADNVDSTTYNKMTTAILEEESDSKASMRFATFPSEEILDQNPNLFHALLNTTLEIEDTIHSLIFTLDFKKDYSDFQTQKNEFDLDENYSDSSFIEFLKKKMIEMEDDLKNGISFSEKNRINDYSSLLNNFNTLISESSNQKLDILA